MSSRCIAGAVLALSMSAAPALAQALGDVARAEEARRTAAAKAKKTYSNSDLGPGAVPEPGPAAAAADSCYMSKQSGGCVSAEELLANSQAAVKVVENAPTEAPIRSEAQKIRAELERLQVLIGSLEEQEGDASLAAAKRQAATDGLAMHRRGLEQAQRRWARLEKQVKDLKLPHEWIEPVPENAIPQQ